MDRQPSQDSDLSLGSSLRGERISLTRPGGRKQLNLSAFTPRPPGPGEVMVRVRVVRVKSIE